MLLGYLILIFPMIALLSLVLYLPVYFTNRKKYGKRPFIRHLAIYALIGTAASIIYITILIYGEEITFFPEYHMLNLVPFAWLEDLREWGGKLILKNLFLNILMFVPLGFFLPIVYNRLTRLWKTIACCFSFSFFVEFFQYFIGRSADIDDLIVNTVGGIIGYCIFAILRHFFRQKYWWKKACALQ